MLNKKPMILVFAGPNGSGKSTITQFFEKVGTYTNADDIVIATGMDNLEAAKIVENGYFIKCIFVLTANPKINIARVKSRALSGGHDVDTGKIVDRYYKSLANIKELMDICDIMHVYDNSEGEPVRIIRKHKDDVSIFPNCLWSADELLKMIGK
jgi:predicted ABC-type ATPase